MTGRDAAIEIRTAGPADIPHVADVQLVSALEAFAHIFPESVSKPLPHDLEAEWAALVDDPASTVLLAEVSGRVVAGIAFGDVPALAPEGYGLLAKLYVRPEYAGRGIGTLLYDTAVSQMREAGWKRLWLWVLEGNAGARGMYNRRGWIAQSERRTDWPGSGVFEMGYALDLRTIKESGSTRP